MSLSLSRDCHILRLTGIQILQLFLNNLELFEPNQISYLTVMYNIKGPSKIVAKTTTRRGISQKIDNYHKKKNIEGDDYNNEANTGPKPTFQKKSSPTHTRHKSISRQHEEVINYIYESWNSVCAQLENEDTDANGNKCQHISF
nr:unnamed protein product [Callosobruchus chinensis]